MHRLVLRHEYAWSESNLAAFRGLPMVHHVEEHESVPGGYSVAILHIATEEDARLLRYMVVVAAATRRDFVAEYLH